jgi:hypothetical protein
MSGSMTLFVKQNTSTPTDYFKGGMVQILNIIRLGLMYGWRQWPWSDPPPKQKWGSPGVSVMCKSDEKARSARLGKAK